MPKRRTKGDGGLTQRHGADCPPAINGQRADHNCTGRWQGTIDVIEAGVRKRKYVYGRTQKEARLKLDQAKREKSDGTLVVASETVGKWLDTWLERQKPDPARPGKGLKPQSYTSYESRVRLYLKPHLGRHRLTALHPDHIDALYDAMREQGLSESSVRGAHLVLHKALKDATKRGTLATNPADRVEAPKKSTGTRTPLTVPEVQAVLQAAGDNPRWWLALFYGMRAGEVKGLRWCDVDWNRRTIRVQQTVIVDNNKLTYGTPKTVKSARIIPMLPKIEARMRLHWIHEGSPAVGVPCGGITGACEHGLVFHNGQGGPIIAKTDWRHWQRLLINATIPPLAPIEARPLHAARNSAASVMEAAGIPDRLVMQIMGHSQVGTTHGYQSADVERMREALVGVDQVLELG